MLTEQTILDLHLNIKSRYNEDIAQSVILEVLKNQDNEKIRSWTGWTRRAAYRIRKKEQLFNRPLINMLELEEFDERDFNKTIDLPDLVDTKLKLKTLLTFEDGKELARYLLGKRKFSREWSRILRNRLATHFE